MSDTKVNETIHIQEYLKRKRMQEQNNKPKLHVNNKTGKITSDIVSSPEFGDRLKRIRQSLQRINNLMAELKEMSNERQGKV